MSNTIASRRCVELTLGVLFALAISSATAQDQQHREREVLDPDSDTWVEQAPPPDVVPDNNIDRARQLLAKGEPRKARKLLRKWFKNPDDDRVYEAEYLLGDTYFECRDFWRAVTHYQTVAENTAGELFRLADGRCVDVARAFLSGQKRILWTIFRLPAYDDGIEILDRVWQREPGTRLGEFALKLKADYYFGNGELGLAQDEYANLALQYPSGRFIQLAMLRTAEAAEASFTGIKFDDRPLIEADARYRQFQDTFPAYAEHEQVDQRLEGIRQQRAAKDLDIAKWYERTRRPDAARFYYEQIVADYPNTLPAADAQSRLRALGAPVDENEQPAQNERFQQSEPSEQPEQSNNQEESRS